METSTKNIKILLVEDDKNICELYAMAFMKEGFKVYTAKDGIIAIEKFYSKEPHIVILDIMMPDVDGYEVLKEIRNNHEKYTPVIMFSNLDMNNFIKNDSIDNVDAYLVKSNFTPSELITKVKEILEVNKILKPKQ